MSPHELLYVLTEFRAGLMRQDGTKLVADPRRGLIRVVRLSDGNIHFQWIERGPDNKAVLRAPEVDWTMARVEPPPPPGQPDLNDSVSLTKLATPGARIFKIAFVSPYTNEESKARTNFFWPQEPNPAGDEALLAAVNAALRTPPDPAHPVKPFSYDDASESMLSDEYDDAMDDEAGGGGGSGRLTAAQLRAALAGCGLPQQAEAEDSGRERRRRGHQQQPAVGAAALAAALQAATGGGGGGDGGGPATAAAAAQAMRALAQAPGPTLGEVLRPDALRPLLTSEEALAALAPHLPEGHRSLAGLLDVVSSAQWRSQLETLSGAFSTAQLDVSQFGLRVKGFTVADLLQAVQDAVDEEEGKEGKKDGEEGGGA